MKNDQLGLELEPGIISVVRIELELDRRDAIDRVTVPCHTYYLGDSSVELYRVEDGKLVRFAIYNRVLSVRRVEE